MALSPPQQQIEPYASLLEEQHLIEDLPGWDAPLRPQSHGRSAFVDPSLPASPLSTTPQRLLSDTRAFETLFKELCPYDVRVRIDHGVAVRAVRFLLLGCRQARSGHRRRAFRWTTGRVRGRAERREGPGGGAKPDPASRQDKDEPCPAQSRPVIPGCIGGPGVVLPSDAERGIRHPHHRAGEPKGARIQAPTWEQRRFNKLSERRSYFSDDAELPRVEYEDIVSGQGVLNKDVEEKDDRRGGIVFEPGDVLYGKLRPYLRNWLNPQFKGIALGDFWVLSPLCVSPGFLFVLIRTSAFERVANESTGTKMPRADWQNVSNTVFLVPSSKKEQQQIGALFQKLDSLITLHQREGRACSVCWLRLALGASCRFVSVSALG